MAFNNFSSPVDSAWEYLDYKNKKEALTEALGRILGWLVNPKENNGSN